jgi:hypothetical protein
MKRDDSRIARLLFSISNDPPTVLLWGALAFFGALLTDVAMPVESAAAQSTYAKAIERAEAQVVDLTAESDLLRSADFLMIYRNPESSYRDAIEFITDPHRTDQQATIAILSMQKLPLYRYIDFCEQILALRQAGIVSQGVFERVLLSGYEWNTGLQENYLDARVRVLLVLPHSDYDSLVGSG